MSDIKVNYKLHDRCVAETDLGAIRRNLLRLKQCHIEQCDRASGKLYEELTREQGNSVNRDGEPDPECGGKAKDVLTFAAVKANAYGHGDIEVAEAIEDVTDYFGTAGVEEALRLRNAGINKNILVLGSAFEEDYEAAVAENITLNVFEYDRAKTLNDTAARMNDVRMSSAASGDGTGQQKKARIHISVDTGMSRLGLTPDEEGLETVRRIFELPFISVDGIFMHFAKADAADKTAANAALERFVAFREMCKASGVSIPIWHCANTAAVIDGIAAECGMDMVRCGIGIYGLYPSDEVDKTNAELEPALTWTSCLTYVKEIKAGTSVSYGYNFTAERDMPVGTVCCGYADGYPRRLSRCGGEVLIRGKRCRIIGNICMDQFMVDLTEVPDAAAGDKVTLIGADGSERITADELAKKCETISYEIVCGISSRNARRYT
ncbi:MAG: alanine racemase [Eubacteriales bacterium]|nr:alanine racemase [Eubacteriales bacterium]